MPRPKKSPSDSVAVTGDSRALHVLRERLQKPLGRTVGGTERQPHHLWCGGLTPSDPGFGHVVFVSVAESPDGQRPQSANKWHEGRSLNIEWASALTRLLDSADPTEQLASKLFLREICRIAAERNGERADFLLDAPELDARIADDAKRREVLGYAARGWSLRTVCARAHISQATLERWRREEPKFDEEFQAAAAERFGAVEDAVFDVATGASSEDGTPDANIGLRLLAARMPEEWASPDATQLAREQVSRLARAIFAVVDGETAERIIALYRGAIEAPAAGPAAEPGALESDRERVRRLDSGSPAAPH